MGLEQNYKITQLPSLSSSNYVMINISTAEGDKNGIPVKYKNIHQTALRI
jgi:hypothetical protein